MRVPTTKPYFKEEDLPGLLQEISSVLKSGRLILGPQTRKLEEDFAAYCGVKRAVAVSSCTAALEIALRYFNVSGKEVIVPTNTFVATSNAVIYAGGHPVLADIKSDTLCLDPSDMARRITPETKGVIVVHVAGLPCPDVDEIRDICRRRGLFLIEDCAHAHGATINGRKTGSLSDAGCFSFYPTKVMTTCTGGMITTDNNELADFALSLRHHGVGAGLTQIINLGNDWLMSEIEAVLGLQQLASLESNLTARNRVAARYNRALADSRWVNLLTVPSFARHSYYKYGVLLHPAIDKARLTQIMENEKGVDLGSVYDPPVHLQPVYQRLFGYRVGSFPVADDACRRLCCLPVFPQMTDDEIDYVLDSFASALPLCDRSQVAA